jgi:hypothetical protein
MDLLEVWTLHLALARGYAGGGAIFMMKQRNIRDKMSNLSNNMMISELLTTITIEIQ